MANPGHAPAPLGGNVVGRLGDAADRAWVRRIVEVVNRILSGQINAVGSVTLATGVTSTTFTDVRIGYQSAILLSPRTQNAAAIMGSLYIDSKTMGSAVLKHLATIETDCTYDALIVS